ncbi:MAG TPA: hypothetical protein VFM18_10820, partial [Methanosarcina sp.]|nr:hypothetical protein [Methanosarcina sp.]
YIRENYPFTELSIYRIDWDSIKDHKFLSMEQAISNPAKVREFFRNTGIEKFQEVVIAYGPREPVILIPLRYILDYPLKNLFDQEWGACFIIGANRDKYGMIKLVKECFVEVDCDEGLVTKS